jgi:hypothetical protein
MACSSRQQLIDKGVQTSPPDLARISQRPISLRSHQALFVEPGLPLLGRGVAGIHAGSQTRSADSCKLDHRMRLNSSPKRLCRVTSSLSSSLLCFASPGFTLHFRAVPVCPP